MKIKFSDIVLAFESVNFGGSYGENQAFACVETGRIYYNSNLSGEYELSDEDYDFTIHKQIPDKRDLDLGKNLVFQFCDEHAPELFDRVQVIFSRKSAYAYFKDLLRENDLLERWYKFEEDATEEALRSWCRENDIEITC